MKATFKIPIPFTVTGTQDSAHAGWHCSAPTRLVAGEAMGIIREVAMLLNFEQLVWGFFCFF